MHTCSYQLRRWPPVRWVLLAVLLATLVLPMATPGPVAAGTDLTYYIGDDVSAEDAAYVREGIALAEQYVAAELTDISHEELVVNVLASEDTTGLDSIAFSGGTYLAFFTESYGWADVAPFARVQVVVHEYIHAYQYYHSRTRYQYLPSWLVEGMAEYLAYDAVIERGLVSAGDVHDVNAWAVSLSPDLPALDDLEDPYDFYAEPGAYSLGHLAVAHLMEGREPADLDRLMKEMRSGQGWKTVFADVFGITEKEFYRSFAKARTALTAPDEVPAAFHYVVPERIEGSVALEDAVTTATLGEQLTILGETEAAAVCRLQIRGESGESVAARTFADATGRVFWLITLPEELGAGPATLTAGCGGERERLEIEIEISSA